MDKVETQEAMRNYLEIPGYWHKYNLAKTKEKQYFYRLLRELASIIAEPTHENGRPPISVRDLFFSAGLKLYSNYSGRKVSSDLKHAELAGFIDKAPHFNTLNSFLNCPTTYDLLTRLLTISALPLKHLETAFSLDSSGFGTYSTERWKKVRGNKKIKSWKHFLKGHICIGTRTNIIASCDVLDGHSGDAPQAEGLLRTLGDNFNAYEVSADKAYNSKRIFQIIESIGATPFIPFKENNVEDPKAPLIWLKMFRYFKNNNERFMAMYHKRSNVETVFAMIKVRLGEHLKCKGFIAQRNELLMKFICHNICCLIQEVFENEIHIDFKKSLESFVDRLDRNEVERKVSGKTGQIKFK